MFSGKFCKISKNTFFTEHVWAIASNWSQDLWEKTSKSMIKIKTLVPAK